MAEDENELLQALRALDEISDELSTPGPFGGERRVHITISESRTRAADFDNTDSLFRHECHIRRKGVVSAGHGHGNTRAAAIRSAIADVRKSQARRQKVLTLKNP